ncbi:transporter [Sulfurimonas paralvinellae]|uniref:Neuromedin U n=1 Tax=Sulfurimonas paralvinellae TaxID=317658 RepID=A0A7M1B8L2_9BACT|nr:transporter [Sulfurimonas paralvinellae]QOP45138.1 hypothetical protein FM071_02035 [Sulfurimonas paralvinellae]
MKIFLCKNLLIISLLQMGLYAKEKSMEELSKEMANPLAQIWNLSFQNNYTTIKGDVTLPNGVHISGKNHINTTLFQPVLPIPLKNGMTAFARPVITYIDAPTGVGIHVDSPVHATAVGKNREAKLGDLILPMGVGIVRTKGWSYGGGVTFIFPTSQHKTVASHQYQAGPTALALYANDQWTVGAHLQHWWGISDDGTKNVKMANHTDIQYFIMYNLPHAWQLRASPHITYNWNGKDDNKLTLPVAFGVGKMIKIGPMPVQLMVEYQKNIIAPDTLAADSTIMMQANFIIKNPFGNL